MSQFIQFQDRIVQRVEVEVRRQNIRLCVICWMLHRGKIIDIIIAGNNNHTAGMLAGRSLDASTTNGKAVCLCGAIVQASFLQKLLNITIGSFFCDCRNRSCFKYVITSKELFCITMGRGLVFTGEVQVDIRCFIAVKSQEGFKRNVVAVPIHFSAAFRAVLWRQVKAGADAAVCDKLAVLALRADIVRR